MHPYRTAADLEAARLRAIKSKEQRASQAMSWPHRSELLAKLGLGGVNPNALRKRFQGKLM